MAQVQTRNQRRYSAFLLSWCRPKNRTPSTATTKEFVSEGIGKPTANPVPRRSASKVLIAKDMNSRQKSGTGTFGQYLHVLVTGMQEIQTTTAEGCLRLLNFSASGGQRDRIAPSPHRRSRQGILPFLRRTLPGICKGGPCVRPAWCFPNEIQRCHRPGKQLSLGQNR